MASMRARTASRGRSSPASIMPSIAASMAAAFIFMKSVRVLSRSRTIARINPALRTLLAREPDAAAEADLAVVDAKVEPASRIAAHPGLVRDGRSVAAVVGERQQNPVVALPALRKRDFHPSPPPPDAPTPRSPRILPPGFRESPATGREPDRGPRRRAPVVRHRT